MNLSSAVRGDYTLQKSNPNHSVQLAPSAGQSKDLASHTQSFTSPKGAKPSNLRPSNNPNATNHSSHIRHHSGSPAVAAFSLS